MNKLYTIGHSTHTVEKFLNLLSKHAINAICDVRSSPYSSYNPQFNRESLIKDLKEQKIAYVYLGKELGPRSDDPACYIDNKVQYDRIAKTSMFLEGLSRVTDGMKKYSIALMCAEKDPIMCHRTILVCRHLRANDLEILHILEDGSLENNKDAEKHLMKLLKMERDLFITTEEQIERAYDQQSQKIAHTIQTDQEHES